MVVSGMLVQPTRNRAIKQPSLAREIRNAICLLIIGCVLYTSEAAGNPYRQDSPNNRYDEGLSIYGDDDG